MKYSLTATIFILIATFYPAHLFAESRGKESRLQEKNALITGNPQEQSEKEIEVLEKQMLENLENTRARENREMENTLKMKSIPGFLSTIGSSDHYFRPFFLLSLYFLFLSTFILALSHIAGFYFSEILRKIATVLVLVTIAPVTVGIASIIFEIQEWVTVLTVALWGCFAAVIVIVRLYMRHEDRKLLEKGRYWQCMRCKAFNDNVYTCCPACDTSRENKPQNQ